jgi:hypothetical protein
VRAVEEIVWWVGSSRNSHQRPKLGSHLLQDLGRREIGVFGPAGSPVGAFHMVGEDYPGDRQAFRQAYLERIALDLRSDRTDDAESRSGVVDVWREYKRRPPPPLLTAGLWRK